MRATNGRTVCQGYDSGEVIGYEIDGDGGTLFMAVESEITKEPSGPR